MEKLNDEQRKLIEDNYHLIKIFRNKYFSTFYDQDEYIGLCHIALCKAALKYDSNRGSFSKCLLWAIRAEVSHHCYCANLDIRKANTEALSFEMPIRDRIGEDCKIGDIVSDHVDITESLIERLALEEKIGTLSKKNRQIVRMMYYGYKQREVAQSLNISQQGVSYVLFSLKKKLGCYTRKRRY